jgi:hypothetical protein
MSRFFNSEFPGGEPYTPPSVSLGPFDMMSFLDPPKQEDVNCWHSLRDQCKAKAKLGPILI